MTNAGRLSAAPGDLIHQDQSQDPTLQPDTNVKMDSDTSSSQQQATASSSSGSECNSGQNTPVTIKQDAMDHDGSSEETQQEDVDDSDGKQEGKRPEYTMDAVLTLMQLNAGWRE